MPKIAKMQTELQDPFKEFLDENKRMGPHSQRPLSRALLINQLVPYLTEQRYAGRLIYGGGDVLAAYTNLWDGTTGCGISANAFKELKIPTGI